MKTTGANRLPHHEVPSQKEMTNNLRQLMGKSYAELLKRLGDNTASTKRTWNTLASNSDHPIFREIAHGLGQVTMDGVQGDVGDVCTFLYPLRYLVNGGKTYEFSPLIMSDIERVVDKTLPAHDFHLPEDGSTIYLHYPISNRFVVTPYERKPLAGIYINTVTDSTFHQETRQHLGYSSEGVGVEILCISEGSAEEELDSDYLQYEFFIPKETDKSLYDLTREQTLLYMDKGLIRNGGESAEAYFDIVYPLIQLIYLSLRQMASGDYAVTWYPLGQERDALVRRYAHNKAKQRKIKEQHQYAFDRFIVDFKK